MRILTTLTLLILATVAFTGKAAGQMAIVNGASFHPDQPLAPGSFATMFGDHLCDETVAGDWIAPGELPTELGGCSVMIDGVPAMLHYVSPGQINFVMPPNLTAGMAQVTATNRGVTANGEIRVGPGPGMFALSGTGMGFGAMLHGTLWRTGPFSTETGGGATHLSLFATGIDLSEEPVVLVGGVPVEVTFFGPAPGFAGLHQVNVVLPQEMAGVGHVPVAIISGGEVSNVTFMEVLPNDMMMQGVPGWGPGMHIAENSPRAGAVAHIVWSQVEGTLLVSDQNANVVRVLSPENGETLATIGLPDNAFARDIEVSPSGGTAAVVLGNLASIALIDLTTETVTSVVGAGFLPTRIAFSGDRLLATNAVSGTVSVIDVETGDVTGEISVGFGPHGIAATASTAVVANLQLGSVSVVDMTDFSVSQIQLPAGVGPMEVAISGDTNEAVVSAPMSNGVYTLDLESLETSFFDTGLWSAMGPGALAVNGSHAYVASMMASNVTVLDLDERTVIRTIPVSPGPRSMAVDPDGSRLFVLSHGTGTVDVIDLSSFENIGRINATATPSPGAWDFPTVSSISPATAAAGTTVELVIAGANLETVTGLEFRLMGPGGGPGSGPGSGMGPGMGSGGGTPGMGHGGGLTDTEITVTDVRAAADGASVTATVQVGAEASAGLRRIVLVTDRGSVTVPGFAATFSVTR